MCLSDASSPRAERRSDASPGPPETSPAARLVHLEPRLPGDQRLGVLRVAAELAGGLVVGRLLRLLMGPGPVAEVTEVGRTGPYRLAALGIS